MTLITPASHVQAGRPHHHNREFADQGLEGLCWLL
jgi:hypothetical protein